jgi:hypothetical protein
MDKRRLSELLDHSAFPLLVLALVVSQISFGRHHRVVLKPERPPAVELPQLNRSESISDKPTPVSSAQASPIPNRLLPGGASRHDR